MSDNYDRQPFAWITQESANRIESGGNNSRGTVPMHSFQTATAKIPLYLNPQECQSSLEQVAWEYQGREKFRMLMYKEPRSDQLARPLYAYRPNDKPKEESCADQIPF